MAFPNSGSSSAFSFSTPQSSSSQPSLFGAASTPGASLFGDSGAGFGTATPASGGLFGSSAPAFGAQGAAFGSSTSAFGSSTSAFGASGSTFGQASSAFSAPIPAFGASSGSAGASTASAFGAASSAHGLFGGADPSTQPSLFGGAQGLSLGVAANPASDSATAPAAAPLFGTPSNASSSAFALPSTSTAGAFLKASSSQATTSFGFGASAIASTPVGLFDTKPAFATGGSSFSFSAPSSAETIAAPSFSFNVQSSSAASTGGAFSFPGSGSVASGAANDGEGFSGAVQGSSAPSTATTPGLFDFKQSAASTAASASAGSLSALALPSGSSATVAASFATKLAEKAGDGSNAGTSSALGAANFDATAGTTTVASAGGFSFSSSAAVPLSASSAAEGLFKAAPFSSGASSAATAAPDAKKSGLSFAFSDSASQPAATDKSVPSGFSLGTPSSGGAFAPAAEGSGGFSFTNLGSSAQTTSAVTAPSLTADGKPTDTARQATNDAAGAGSVPQTTAALTSVGLGAIAATASSSVAAATSSAGILTGQSAALAQTTSAPLTVPSDVKDLSLDEVVNKWTEEVAELSTQFRKGAAMVSKWDRAIVSNEDKIRSLHRDAQSLQIAHKELSDNLDVILSQQSELHTLLDALELDVERKIGLSQSNSSGNGTVSSNSRPQGDVEREGMHRLSIEVMEELDAMALIIRDLVVELNKGSDLSGSDRSGDTVSQIISVLNAHLDSLQYLDETSSALHKRLADVQRTCEIATRESDRMYGRRAAGLF